MIYMIDIENGKINYDIAHACCGLNGEANAKQYFGARGLKKPKKVKVKGWPWTFMYITHGNEENGCAVAWKAKVLVL